MDDEQPAFELLNQDGTGLRVWANGGFTGRQPPKGAPHILINRIPDIVRAQAKLSREQEPATKQWWDDIALDIRRLARALCADPDQMVIPYLCAEAEQPRGRCTMVNTNDLVPYWTMFRDQADLALRLARKQAGADQLQQTPDEKLN